MILQQAIFTSARTERSDGYHLVACSKGISAEDKRELAVWGPSHDSLCNPTRPAVSYFPLKSGAFCVARTSCEQWEHSGRGRRIHSHMLIVAAEDFADANFHPLVVYGVAQRFELFRGQLPSTALLPEVELESPCSQIESELLELASTAEEMNTVPALGRAQSGAERLALLHATRPLHLLAGLFFWLPQAQRRDCTFTTGLKFSPRRPFRLMFVDGSSSQQRKLVRSGFGLFDTDAPQHRDSPPTEGWRAELTVATPG